MNCPRTPKNHLRTKTCIPGLEFLKAKAILRATFIVVLHCCLNIRTLALSVKRKGGKARAWNLYHLEHGIYTTNQGRRETPKACVKAVSPSYREETRAFSGPGVVVGGTEEAGERTIKSCIVDHAPR